MTTEKPTILLIPGAWHKASTYDPVANILREKGYHAETITLPSAGGPPSTTAYDDANHIQKAYLNDLVAQGKEVILVMHSYAGIPGTESVKGFARKDLAASGKRGGVVGLIYQSAFILPAGESVESFLPGGLERFMVIDKTTNLMLPISPLSTFYNDLDPETANKYLSAIVPHSPEAMRTRLTYEAYRDVPTTYIFCTRDAGFPLIAQRKIASIPGKGLRTYSIDAGHFAMLSQPGDVAGVVCDVVGGGEGGADFVP